MNRQLESGSARFCATNPKGGTEKMTVAINVAGALNDRDVRFIDLDPQSNATGLDWQFGSTNTEVPT